LFYAEKVVDTRLKLITEILSPTGVDRRVVVDHEIANDRFIKNFIQRMHSKCPEPGFLAERLRRVGRIPEE
jgi:hypothetical protein